MRIWQRIDGLQGLVILAVIVLLSATSCRITRVLKSRLTKDDNAITSIYEDQPVKPEVNYYVHGGRRMRYVTIGADSLPPLLLLHGSPGSWSSWDDVFLDSAIYNHVHVIAPDRPGYGYSDFGRSFTSIIEEARFLQDFIADIAPSGVITIAGSSYGGSVAVQVAINNADRLNSLVLISASTKPGAEKIYGITPFIQNNNMRGLVPLLLRMPNDEKIAHAASLREIAGWDKIAAPVWIIHGDADNLVYFSNARYSRQKLVNAPVRLITVTDAGHDINWKRPELVGKYLRLAIRPSAQDSLK